MTYSSTFFPALESWLTAKTCHAGGVGGGDCWCDGSGGGDIVGGNDYADAYRDDNVGINVVL